MQALIDGDIIIYRVGFTTEDVDVPLACVRATEVVEGILKDVNATSFKIYLTEENDPNAFRKQIYPEYKAHRKKEKPRWYKELRDYLQVQYDAELCYEIEADDALGIQQTQNHWDKVDSIICSIDKDLKQIRGDHYNFVKKEFAHVEVEAALRTFYMQLLTGDSADNIKGVYNIGPKKAEQILGDRDDVVDMFDVVRETYGNDEEMLMNGRVLWIWKRPNDDWKQHWDQLLISTR